MYDPFRLQFLTVSLDSEIVLALIGILAAGFVARVGARRLGLAPGDAWDMAIDIAQWSIIGARLGWVLTHLNYYGRAPVQIMAIGDGGFLFATGVLAAAWQLWRMRRRLAWTDSDLARVAAPAIAVALLFDRVGCALTGCGTGQPTSVPWAMIRSGVAVHPVGLYGVAIWLFAWSALQSPGLWRRPSFVWPLLLGCLLLERTSVWALGHDGTEGALAVAALLATVAAARRWPGLAWPFRGASSRPTRSET